MTEVMERPTGSGGPERIRVRKRRKRRTLIRGHPVRTTLVVVALVGLAVLAASAYRGYTTVRDEGAAARTALESARSGLESLFPSEGPPGTVAADLASARASVGRARAALDGSIGLRVAARLPVSGPALDSTRDLLEVADAVAAAAESGVDTLGNVQQAAAGGRFVTVADGEVSVGSLGAAALPGLERAEAALEGARDSARRLENPSGPARDYAPEAIATFHQIHDTITKAAAGARLATWILAPDRSLTFLVALRNNAEMRADGGMVLSVARLDISDGSLEFGDVESVGPLTQTKDVPIDVPDWYRNVWGPYGALQLFQSTGYTAHFPTSAPVLAGLYEAAKGERPDGVITIDPVAITALIAATGPLKAAKTNLDAGTAVPYLLNEQYAIAERDDAGRREMLGAVAESLFERVLAGGWDERTLGTGLAAAAGGGHVQLWMRDPSMQQQVARLGLSGGFAESDGDFLRPAVSNAGGNKLDYFVERDIRHTVALQPDGSARLVTEMTLTNPATTDQPDYVLGGAEVGANLEAGEYQGFVGMYGPPGAGLVEWQDAGGVLQSGIEAGYPTYRVWLTIPPGESRTVSFEAEIAAFERDWRSGQFTLVVQPQALVRPDNIRVRVEAPDGWLVEGGQVWEGTVLADRLSTTQLAIAGG